MNNIGPLFIAIVGGAFTLAMLAVALSRKAQTSTVITSGGNALGSVISAAVAPVTGSAPSFGSAIGGSGGLNPAG